MNETTERTFDTLVGLNEANVGKQLSYSHKYVFLILVKEQLFFNLTFILPGHSLRTSCH